MNDAKFEEIVLDSVTDRHANHMYGDENIEAEIRRRLKEAVDSLHEDFEESKYVVLRQALNAFRDERDLGFNLVGLLAADNIYEIQSFVAYDIGPILKKLESRGPERSGSTRAPGKKPAGRQHQARSIRKSNPRSLKVPKAFSTPRPSSSASSTIMTLRRSSRLAHRSSQPQGIRKTPGKAR